VADAAWIYEMVSAWSAHDGAKVASFLTEDAIWEDVGSRLRFDPAQFAEAFSTTLPAMSSDSQFEVVSAVCDDVGFALQWRWFGTHNETARTFSVRAATVGRLRDGRIAAAFDYWNPAQLADQISGGAD
jgi:ketosteroid isomerase-like protein